MTFDVKAEYTLGELAVLMGRSAKRTERVLKGAEVTIHVLGGRKTVFLSELKEKLPSLWDSVVIRSHYKRR